MNVFREMKDDDLCSNIHLLIGKSYSFVSRKPFFHLLNPCFCREKDIFPVSISIFSHPISPHFILILNFGVIVEKMSV